MKFLKLTTELNKAAYVRIDLIESLEEADDCTFVFVHMAETFRVLENADDIMVSLEDMGATCKR